MLHAVELTYHLAGLRLAHPLYVFQQLGSTNDEAKTLADAGAPEGLLVLAETQTAGRGRQGRRWLTPPGTALAFSLVLRPALPAAQAARLVMLAGVAVAEAVEHTAGVHAQLKWPNDVLLNGRKVAGILVESALREADLEYAILGIGLNVSWAPEGMDFPATSVEAEAGRPVDRTALLRAILERLEAGYPGLAGEAVWQAYHPRLAWLGQPTEVRLEGETLIGQAEAVTADGQLVFRLTSGEVRHLLAGNLHLRPRDHRGHGDA